MLYKRRKTKGVTMIEMENQELNSSLSHSHSVVFSPPYHSPLHIFYVITLIIVTTRQLFKPFFFFWKNVVFYQERTHHTSA